MKTRNHEKGDATAIVFAVLVVLLMTALGVIFYQNFITKPTAPVDKTETKSDLHGSTVTARVAFNSDIYELDHPGDWTVTTENLKDSRKGGSLTKIANDDKTVEVVFRVSEKNLEVSCDESLKVRYYNVHETAVTELGETPVRLVEAISERKGGGYNYAVGLAQEGGATHSSVGAPRCTVMDVGVVSDVRLSEDGQILQPSITAKIDFPKLPEAATAGAKSMDEVTKLMETDDYKSAIEIIESARKK